MSSSLLKRLGHKYATDKVTVHGFHVAYASHFQRLRKDKLKVLELGIGGEDYELGGASLKMWEEYFPNSQIIGVDLYPKSELDGGRIQTIVGDASDPEFLAELVEKHGPFDIVIDDASHKVHDTLVSLFGLIHAVNSGGFYVIEDIQTSYWPTHGGTSIAINIAETPVAWLKNSIDIVNRRHILGNSHYALDANFPLNSVSVYPNIAFLGVGESKKQNIRLPQSVVDDMIVADEYSYGALKDEIRAFERDRLSYFQDVSSEQVMQLEMGANAIETAEAATDSLPVPVAPRRSRGPSKSNSKSKSKSKTGSRSAAKALNAEIAAENDKDES